VQTGSRPSPNGKGGRADMGGGEGVLERSEERRSARKKRRSESGRQRVLLVGRASVGLMQCVSSTGTFSASLPGVRGLHHSRRRRIDGGLSRSTQHRWGDSARFGGTRKTHLCVLYKRFLHKMSRNESACRPKMRGVLDRRRRLLCCCLFDEGCLLRLLSRIRQSDSHQALAVV
jgi:hypothetical protein